MKSFLKSEDGNEQMSLQITSMADIFTIILIFLLKSFATGMATISPPQGMVLPQITAQVNSTMKEALRVEIVKEAILVDSKPVARLFDFKLPAEPTESLDELGQAANTPVSRPVIEALGKERLKYVDLKTDSNLIVLAHEKAPYSTIKTVINSAAVVGYVDLQLVVVGSD